MNNLNIGSETDAIKNVLQSGKEDECKRYIIISHSGLAMDRRLAKELLF